MNNQVLTTIASLISLLGICYLFFWRYRAFELAWFRQDLFCLRDELFDFAASGKISFDHRAYGVLRSCMNGYIRYGDRLTIWHGFFFKLCAIGAKRPSVTFDHVWSHAQKGLDPETKNELDQLRNRMERIAIRHVLVSAPEGTAILLPPLFLVCAVAVAIKLREAWNLRENVSELDNTAYLFGDELAAA